MALGSPCVWVTSILNDVDLRSAQLLAVSVTRSGSNLPLFVLIPSNSQLVLLNEARGKFNNVMEITVPEDFKGPGATEIFMKLFCWNLSFIPSCVYVPPNGLVLKNCDTLFTSTENSGEILMNALDGKLDGCCMRVVPNHSVYAEIKKDVLDLAKDGLEIRKAFLHAVVKNCKVKPVNLLAEVDNGNLAHTVWTTPIVIPCNINKDADQQEDKLNLAAREYLKDLMSQIIEIGKNKDSLAIRANEPIAIIGASCRFPKSDSVEEFWSNLLSGVDCVSPVPPYRWTPQQSCDPVVVSNSLEAGFLKCDVQSFDNLLFGLGHSELEYTDPQHRLLLQVAWEAVENAGIQFSDLKGPRASIFVGEWTQEYRDLMIQTQAVKNDFFRFYTCNGMAGCCGRLARVFGTTGDVVTMESGCASSTQAVGEAMRNLRARRSDISLACGVNLLLKPYTHENVHLICSKDARCKSFDASANGYVRAEGVATLVLKRLSDACASGDNIIGILSGYGVVQDSLSQRFGRPSTQGEADAMRMAVKDACLPAEMINFVEAHGTGTEVGDNLEVEAIKEVYTGSKVLIGAVKSNIGHTESCSGLASVIKVMLSLEKEVIPGNLHFKKLNPRIDLDNGRLSIVSGSVEYKKDPKKKRVCAVNNFGICGSDAHLVMEEVPTYIQGRKHGLESLPNYVVTITAKTDKALNALRSKYEDYLAEQTPSINSLAYHTTLKRNHFSKRIAILGKNCKDIHSSLKNEAFLVRDDKQDETEAKSMYCFLFPGQGCQISQVGRVFYDYLPSFRQVVTKCDLYLKKRFNISALDLLWSDQSDLSKRFSQVGLFILQVAFCSFLKQVGINPDIVLGHSLGEYAAAVVAEIMSIEDTLFLLIKRTELLEQYGRGKMLAVGGDLNKVQRLVATFYANNGGKLKVDIAADNSTTQITVAGTASAVDEFKDFCDKEGVPVSLVGSDFAFHSYVVEPILEQFLKSVEAKEYKKASCRFLSALKGDFVHELESDYWVSHIRKTVNFREAVRKISDPGSLVFIEIGPKVILSSFLRQNVGNSIQRNVFGSFGNSVNNQWDTMLMTITQLYLRNVEINWKAIYGCVKHEKISLPFYPFESKPFWFPPRADQQYSHAMPQKQIQLEAKSIAQNHELLGQLEPSSTENRKIFKTCLDLNRLPYLIDHAIGNAIVFPCAGYIEMIIAAGGGSNHIVEIADLTVKAALKLEQDKTNTVITELDTSKQSVSITSKRPGGGSNLIHCSATVQSRSADSAAVKVPTIDTSSWSSIMPALFYKKVEQTGINFGPAFCTLSSIHTSDKQVFSAINVSSGSSGNLVHPLPIDAMIQTSLIAVYGWSLSRLVLPVFVKKVFHYPQVKGSSSLFVYAKLLDNGKVSVYLVDSDFNVILHMEGLDFAQTTLEHALASMSKNSEVELPLFYEEVWKKDQNFGVTQIPFLRQILPDDATTSDPAVTEEERWLDKAIGIELFLMMRKIGLVDGPSCVVQERLRHFPAFEGLLKPFRNFLTMLEQDGYCQITEDSERKLHVKWSVVNVAELESELSKARGRITTLTSEYGFASKYVGMLDVFLTNEITPLSILFPKEKRGEHSAADFYSTSRLAKSGWGDFSKCFDKVVNSLNPEAHLNILEIGAGTGSCTKSILKVLSAKGIKFTYTFTDISSAFFPGAASVFADSKESWCCRVLDIEKDPKKQGFAPAEYDIVFAAYVIHATSSIKRSVSHMRQLLKPRGLCLLLETFGPQRCLDATFGLLHGYWNFTDFDLRPNHCLLSDKLWKNALVTNGFDTVDTAKFAVGGNGIAVAQANEHTVEFPKHLLPADGVATCIVYNNDLEVGKPVATYLKSVGCKVVEVQGGTKVSIPDMASNGHKLYAVYVCRPDDNVKDLRPTETSQHFLLFCKELVKHSENVKSLTIVSKGAIFVEPDCQEFSSASAFLGFCRTLRSEYPSVSVVNVDIDSTSTSASVSLLVTKALFDYNCKPFLVLRQNECQSCSLKEMKVEESTLAIPDSEFELELPASRKLEDVKLIPVLPRQLPIDHVKIDVKAYGVNFRDVFVIRKPSKEFESYIAVCPEYCGVITEVGSAVKDRSIGQRVCGVNFTKLKTELMQSHYVVNWEETVPIPDSFSYEDGATLNIAFNTAYHSLYDCAKMKEGQTVLVHSAAGGLGLMAIQLAHKAGITVIATCSTERKKSYLRELGVQHIFDSRSLSFSDKVLDVTGGKGVDVVINSLTGEGFVEASVKCLKKGGVFVEVSRLNTWTEEQFRAVKPDLKVFYVNLAEPNKELWYHLCRKLEEMSNSGVLEPLPLIRYQLPNLVNALKYITQGKHIGKLVISRPEADVPQRLFSPTKTYLLTGGLTGLGLQVALMMGRSGAKNLALFSRSAPGKEALEVLDTLKGWGVNVMTRQLDAGDLPGIKQLLHDIATTMPPLGGVFHLSGTLSDNLLSNMEPSQIATVYKGKVDGAWYLHTLTKKMNLEYFVLFSSVAAMVGAMGQANHAAANSFLDQLAKYRVAKGYNATSINWGQWGETGSAVGVVMKGISPMSNASGIRALELALAKHYSNVMVFNGSIPELIERFPWMNRYIIRRDLPKNSDVSGLQLKDTLDTVEGRSDRILGFVRRSLASLLQLELHDIQDNVPFESMGLDSLIAIELKNVIQGQVEDKINITSNTILEHNTVQKLGRFIESSLANKTDYATNTVVSEQFSSDGLKQLIMEDRKLLRDTLGVVSGKAVKPSDIRTVLITGITGTMGACLLESVTRLTQLTKIYCLIRPTSNVQQLKSKMASKDIKADSIIQFIAGDLNQDQLGLDEATYSRLSNEVDAIFHFGAYVNHIQLYNNDPSCLLRQTNVLGTMRVLKFATTSKLKWVFHASTFVCVLKVAEGPRMPETWPYDDEYDNASSVGYSTSKHVAELLVKDAASLGVPIKMLRFPAVAGNSKTGESDIVNTHYGGRVIACLKSGMVPDIWSPMPMLPVDTCTDLAVKLCLKDNTPVGVYHIIHPKPGTEPDLVKDLQSTLGINNKVINMVSFDEFVEEQRKVGKSSPLWPYIESYIDKNGVREIVRLYQHVREWKKNPNQYYQSQMLDKYLPGWDQEIEPLPKILGRDIMYAMKQNSNLFGQ